MKKLLLVGLVCALPAQAGARVLDFHSDIRVARSGELTVTERITLEVQANTDGLLRDLPASVNVIDVIRNGHPESYAFEGARLRIGGAPLSPGRHLYQIAYRSAGRIRFLDGHDELRWQVNDRGFGIERLTAEVTLPAAVPAREIKAEGAGRDYQSFVRDGRAAFRSKEGMTIVVRFPKGVVLAEPGIDYKGLLAVLAGLGLTGWVLVRLKKPDLKNPWARR
jgi:hypothetical protein